MQLWSCFVLLGFCQRDIVRFGSEVSSTTCLGVAMKHLAHRAVECSTRTRKWQAWESEKQNVWQSKPPWTSKAEAAKVLAFRCFAQSTFVCNELLALWVISGRSSEGSMTSNNAAHIQALEELHVRSMARQNFLKCKSYPPRPEAVRFATIQKSHVALPRTWHVQRSHPLVKRTYWSHVLLTGLTQLPFSEKAVW